MSGDNVFIKSVAVVAFKADKVLLIKSSETSGHLTGIYSLPAGRLEKDETYIQAGLREFEEESGLKSKEEYLIRLPTFYKADLKRKSGSKKFCAWSFYCTKYWGKLKASTEGKPQWIDTNKLKGLSLQVNVEKMIIETMKHMSQT
jgi:ADP-ribose pyrophosphatase YjhB (NUDIX family)